MQGRNLVNRSMTPRRFFVYRTLKTGKKNGWYCTQEEADRFIEQFTEDSDVREYDIVELKHYMSGRPDLE